MVIATIFWQRFYSYTKRVYLNESDITRVATTSTTTANTTSSSSTTTTTTTMKG